MKPIILTKQVNASLDVVFDVASDLANAAEHIQGIERIELLTPEPVGVGTKWRETRKIMGKEATETMEVTAFDPPRSYTVEADSCGCHFLSTFRFTPESDGTRVELEVASQANTLMAKLMSPISALMAGTMKKMMDQDLEDLKRVAESRAS